ncbi:hypothetical protein N7492_006629 [Penicillium capsulatum]|uniref:BTB domain-containing protein n=1 Tax=Penicillium capsulatum TaxID=69766 RepID=A0A9W9LJY7_9EURO|nr:hypothetical protein N7492_006629 [Penicillium capsulatum]KAJ6116464.1 hypothetical protein N7512_006189 [Penicillium capsulatum]
MSANLTGIATSHLAGTIVSQDDNLPRLETPDQAGDVIIVIEGQSTAKFLVSSKNDSRDLARNSAPRRRTSGHEDDISPPALPQPGGNRELDAKALATVAVHCDKYDCVRALKIWAVLQLGKIEAQHPKPTEMEIGMILTTAYFFECSEVYTGVSRQAQMAVTPGFLSNWQEDAILCILPESVRAELEECRENIVNEIHSMVQSVERVLRGYKECHEIQEKLCVSCGRTHRAEASECDLCDNPNLIWKYCTEDARVAALFDTLHLVKLWPALELFQECCLSEISRRIFILPEMQLWEYTCAKGSLCPLTNALRVLR